MITIVLLTSVHADKSPAIRVEEIHMFWVRFHTLTLLHNQPILASFLLPEGRKGNKYGRSGQQIWVGMRNKYGGRVEPLMCWMEFSIHASGTFQSAERSSIAMELLPRDLQRWYRFLSFLDVISWTYIVPSLTNDNLHQWKWANSIYRVLLSDVKFWMFTRSWGPEGP